MRSPLAALLLTACLVPAADAPEKLDILAPPKDLPAAGDGGDGGDNNGGNNDGNNNGVDTDSDVDVDTDDTDIPVDDSAVDTSDIDVF